MLIFFGFTLLIQLEDIKFDDLPDHQRGPEVQFCCLTAGVRSTIYPACHGPWVGESYSGNQELEVWRA